jgi:hypothetical protein
MSLDNRRRQALVRAILLSNTIPEEDISLSTDISALYERYLILTIKNGLEEVPSPRTFMADLSTLGFGLLSRGRGFPNLVRGRQLLDRACWTPDCDRALGRSVSTPSTPATVPGTADQVRWTVEPE